MPYKGNLIKTGLILCVTLVLLAGGLVSPLQRVSADDLPHGEGAPLPPAPEEEYAPDQIIVKFKPAIDHVSEDQLNEDLGTDVVYTSPFAGFKVLRIPEGKTVAEMVTLYSGQSIVEYAEPNYIDHITWSPNDFLYDLQWHFDQINLEAAWDLDTDYGGDPSIVVAVIDTGVAYETYSGNLTAPDLASTNFWTNPGEIAGNSVDDDGNLYVDDIHGWDFVNNDAHPNDDNRHGTHVTGTIAQSTNNSIGVAGIAFNTTIMPLKTLGTGGGYHTQFSDAYHYAADNGAHIINYSGGGTASATKAEAVAYARDAGVIIIAAMGNAGDEDNTIEYPAAYDAYVIAVGATSYNMTRSYYSSYGAHCDIAAPGGDMTVDLNEDGYGDGVLQQTFAVGDPTTFGYYFLPGTSMATPHVSGVAALILAKNPGWNPAQVRNAIQSTATDLGTAGKDDEYGWGLIDAYDAVNSSLATTASYSNATHTPPTCEEFDEPVTESTAYMYVATGLLPDANYRVAYYDGDDSKVATEDVTSGASGNISSQHTFDEESDVAGTWNVIVCGPSHTPSDSYNGTWSYTITSDSFFVADSAIPEFPTVMAVIVALSLCAGIYLWMRRKAVPVPVKSSTLG